MIEPQRALIGGGIMLIGLILFIFSDKIINWLNKTKGEKDE